VAPTGEQKKRFCSSNSAKQVRSIAFFPCSLRGAVNFLRYAGEAANEYPEQQRHAMQLVLYSLQQRLKPLWLVYYHPTQYLERTLLKVWFSECIGRSHGYSATTIWQKKSTTWSKELPVHSRRTCEHALAGHWRAIEKNPRSQQVIKLWINNPVKITSTFTFFSLMIVSRLSEPLTLSQSQWWSLATSKS